MSKHQLIDSCQLRRCGGVPARLHLTGLLLKLKIQYLLMVLETLRLITFLRASFFLWP